MEERRATRWNSNTTYECVQHVCVRGTRLAEAAILRHAPLEPEAALLEHLVEADPMAVALGVREDTVAVKQDGHGLCVLLLHRRRRP